MKNMKKITYLGTIGILGLLITVSITGALHTTNLGTYSTEKQSENWVQMNTIDIKPVKLDVKAQPMGIKPLLVGTDTRITSSDLNEGHPAIDVDYNGNPFMLCNAEMDYWDSDIYMRMSPDGGETWPDEMAYIWGLEDTYATNPHISFFEDGIRAAGTHETKEQIPELNVHKYMDINDPNTWVMGTIGLDSSTYLEETAVVTSGDCVAFLVNIDFNAQGYNIEETWEIFWTCDFEAGTYPGVFCTRETIMSNICATSGERVYFCYQQLESNGRTRIYDIHCDLDENTEYTDWGGNVIASSATGNCTNPDIDSSGEDVYMVYMDDTSGNQDIYCRTLTPMGYWEKNVVAESQDDEMYPSIVCYGGGGATCTFIKNGDLYVTHTTDGGKTWIEPEKVNDEAGSVVEEHQTADIATSGHVVWTDNRNGNTDVYYDNVGSPSVPIIQITSISPGFGVSAVIENTGTKDATDVQWSINLDGEKVFFGEHTEGTIPTLAAGDSKKVKTGLVLGFGPVTIKVTADGKTEEESATIFLILVR
jgi:hypothetical protein